MVRRPRCMIHHFQTQFFRPAQLPLTLLKAVKDQNMASRFDNSHRPHHARHLSHTITDGRAQEWRLIQRHPLSHRSSHEPSSQRRHLDISGWSKVLEGAHSSATFLYLTASLILPPLLQLEECFVRGNCIKYFRVPEETVERVKEESLKRPAEVCPFPSFPCVPSHFCPNDFMLLLRCRSYSLMSPHYVL